MTRKTVIRSPLRLGARRTWNLLAKGLNFAGAEKGALSDLPPEAEKRITLQNPNHKLEFDARNACLLSLRSTIAPDQEFAVSSSLLPVFVIQFLDAEKSFRQIASTEARKVNIRTVAEKLTADFTGLGGLD